ncbi:hypothetical protein THAOC_10058, partial [Thalassiosira oceanica]
MADHHRPTPLERAHDTTMADHHRPTPLERAHACHILLTRFGVPAPAASSSTDLEEVRVAGRNAVPFLSSSGVERGVLRLIWSVADPENVGTLTARGQFHTLLRLVAMAQAGMLPLLPDSLDDRAKMDLLREALQKTSHLTVNLPTFQAEDSPTVAYLLGTYPAPPSSSTGGGGLDFRAAGTAAWQQHPGAGMPEQPVKQMSVSDAFGSLPEVEDRPLPPLPVATAAVPEEADVAGGDDDFGKFDGAGVEGSAVEGDEGFGQFDSSGHLDSKSYAVTDTQSAVEEDEVGGFGGTNFGPGQLDSNANDEMNAQPAVEDEFGDFDTSNIGLDSNAFDERNAQPAVEDEFGDFGTVNIGQPAATGIGTAAVKDFGGTCSDQPVGAGFGAGGESGQFDSNQLGSSDRLGSISNGDGDTQPAVEDDEFGDFGTSIGQPAATGVGQSREGLPSPDVSFGAGTAQDITKGISEQQQKISQHADPDIGGLETVDVKLAADHVAGIEFGNWGGSEVVSLDDPDTTPLGVAGTISTNSNDQVGVGQVLSISDAFGEIEEDAPLPSLSALSSTVEVVSDEVQSISADPGRAVPKEGGLSNDGRDFGFAEPLDEGTDAALPDVAGDTPAPLNVVADSAEVHSTDSIIEDIYEQHVATEDANNIFSAFDALAPADAPLPLMSDMAFIVPKVTEADTISTKISEEGALGEQNAEESPYSQFRAEDNAPEKNVPEMLSAFDVLGVHDAPLPSLDEL